MDSPIHQPSIIFQAGANCIDFQNFAYEAEILDVGRARIGFESKGDPSGTDLVNVSVVFAGLFTADKNKILTGTREYVARIIELASAFFELPITLLGESCISLDDASAIIKKQPDGSTSVQITETMGFGLSPLFKEVTNLIDENKPRFAAFLDNNLSDVSYYWHEYYAAISCKDTIASYMLLYGILLQLHSDKQDTLDDEIEIMEPMTQTFPKPSNGNKRRRDTETSYTKARNQIAHDRGVGSEEKRKDINNNLGKLRSITKKMINQHHIESRRCPV